MFSLDRDFTQPGRSAAIAENGMAATSHPLATLAALDILHAGGNAIDAAVAAVAVQGVVDPHMTGVGGDLFAIVAPAGGKVTSLNASGPAPRATRLEALRAEGLTAVPETSPYAVTIPGAVDGWCKLIEKFGRLGLEQVLAPAIRFAEEGYRVTPRVRFDWHRARRKLAGNAAAARHFLRNGEAPAIGDRMSNPALGRTLRGIAQRGRAALYEGEVAADIVATLRALGGVHAEDDLASYQAQWTVPISADYRGYTIKECPPNGQGLAALIIARILSGFDLAEEALSPADRIHILAEASKAAYAQRDALVADPDHAPFDVAAVLADKAIAALRDRIRMDRATDFGSWDMPAHRDTVYLTVVDKDRNAISLINSLFSAFGSGIFAEKSGIMLQNRGCGFSLVEGHPNAIAGGKRPLHTIIPGLLEKDGRPVMPFGVMGGQYQATGHAQLISHIVDRGMNPQAANAAPRSFAFGGELSLETTIDPAIADDLTRRGHTIAWASEPIGGSQAIWIDHDRGLLIGASDHRKDGLALGY